MAQSVKNLPTMQETQLRSLGREFPLEKEMASHSSILAWKTPWTEEPGGLQSMGSQRAGQDWATKPPQAFGMVRLLENGFEGCFTGFSHKGAAALHAQLWFLGQGEPVRGLSTGLESLATWCEERTHWKRPWCWERLKAGGEGDGRGWDGWMASPTRWAWVWVSSGSLWWTGVLRFMVWQRVRQDWAELKM